MEAEATQSYASGNAPDVASSSGDTPKTLLSTSTIDTRSTRTQSAKLLAASNAQSSNGPSESSATGGPSSSSGRSNRNFLDNVPEDEKRIRMRHLPNAEGIRGLHKSEIKSDLKAARASNDYSTLSAGSPILSAQDQLANPTVAASITCYNPPTLPESTALKKQERFKRWLDGKSTRSIEDDIKSFRKTVQRTLDELSSLNTQRSQLQCVNNTIKKNLLVQLDLFSQESDHVDKAFQNMLEESDVNDIVEFLDNHSDDNFNAREWKPNNRCNSYVVPGDTVTSQYGQGIVKDVVRTKNSSFAKVKVLFPFGTAFLTSGSFKITEKEKWIDRWSKLLAFEDVGACYIRRASTDMKHVITDGYSDVSPDLKLPPTLDPFSVVTASSASSVSSGDESESVGIAAESKDEQNDVDFGNRENDHIQIEGDRLLPFGDAQLPAAISREDTAHIDLQELQLNVKKYLFDTVPRGKIKLPETVSGWENIRDKIYVAKARVLQKRNQLEVQKQMKQLNSKGLASCHDRLQKHKSLCKEMNEDLISLKERLAEELVELNISEEKVENMIVAHLREREQSRPKKKRKGADKESREKFVPRISRRKAEEMKQASKQVEDDSQEDNDEVSVSGSRRGKRSRGSNGDDESVGSAKPKRSYNRRT